MKKCSGFTVIELLFVIIMLTVGLGVAVVQIQRVKKVVMLTARIGTKPKTAKKENVSTSP